MDAVPSEGCGNFAYERAGRRFRVWGKFFGAKLS